MEVKRTTYHEAGVNWWHPDSESPAYWLVTVTRVTDDGVCFFFVQGHMMELYLPLLLTAGSEYKVSVAAMSHIFLDANVLCFFVYDEGTVNFRAGTSVSCCMMPRDQPNSREKMLNFTVEFLKCPKFHKKFTEGV